MENGLCESKMEAEGPVRRLCCCVDRDDGGLDQGRVDGDGVHRTSLM